MSKIQCPSFLVHYGKGINYTYGNSQWGDLLTAFNGNIITYDTVGNPLQYYDGKLFTWTQGRRLSAIYNNGSMHAAYTYDDNGIRTSKYANGTVYQYTLNGSQIVSESIGSHIVIYRYKL